MFEKGNTIGHRFTKKTSKQYGRLGGIASGESKKVRPVIYTDRELKRRSAQMRELNRNYRTARKCRYCNIVFEASLKEHACKNCKKTAVLMRKYGITEQEYLDMLKKQNGVCVLCEVKKARDIDHCHKTGKVRGILCRQCNYGLQYFDNLVVHDKMLKYSKMYEIKK